MVKEPKSFHANFYQTHSLIHVQNTFLMKDTYLFTGKLLLGNYVKFDDKFFSRMLSSTLLITVMSIV